MEEEVLNIYPVMIKLLCPDCGKELTRTNIHKKHRSQYSNNKYSYDCINDNCNGYCTILSNTTYPKIEWRTK